MSYQVIVGLGSPTHLQINSTLPSSLVCCTTGRSTNDGLMPPPGSGESMSSPMIGHVHVLIYLFVLKDTYSQHSQLSISNNVVSSLHFNFIAILIKLFRNLLRQTTKTLTNQIRDFPKEFLIQT